MKFPEKQTSNSGLTTLAGVMLGLMALIGIVVVQSIVSSFVISTLWSWYVVPFFGVKELPLIFAFGLSLIVSYFQPVYKAAKEHNITESVCIAIAHPVLALFMGWIGTLFI